MDFLCGIGGFGNSVCVCDDECGDVGLRDRVVWSSITSKWLFNSVSQGSQKSVEQGFKTEGKM